MLQKTFNMSKHTFMLSCYFLHWLLFKTPPTQFPFCLVKSMVENYGCSISCKIPYLIKKKNPTVDPFIVLETQVVLYTLWTIEQYPNYKLYSVACLNTLIIFFFWSTICIIDLTEHVENCLSKLNFKKFIVLGGIRANCDMKLNLNGMEIERVNENMLLGVTADLELSWKYLKLLKAIGMLYKTRDMPIFCHSLVMLYMSHCVIYGEKILKQIKNL